MLAPQSRNRGGLTFYSKIALKTIPLIGTHNNGAPGWECINGLITREAQRAARVGYGEVGELTGSFGAISRNLFNPMYPGVSSLGGLHGSNALICAQEAFNQSEFFCLECRSCAKTSVVIRWEYALAPRAGFLLTTSGHMNQRDQWGYF